MARDKKTASAALAEVDRCLRAVLDLVKLELVVAAGCWLDSVVMLVLLGLKMKVNGESIGQILHSVLGCFSVGC